MHLAVSNVALPAFDHLPFFSRMRDLGVEAVEISPSRTWPDPEFGVTSTVLSAYRKALAGAGLKVVGLHDLLDDRPDLDMFGDDRTSERTADYLVRLSEICRDLGGRTLVWGPRWRRSLPVRTAWRQCREFLEALLPRIEPHGTVLCFAPTGLSHGDLCPTAKDCYLLTNAIDHPSFGLHLGAAALRETGEMGHATFAAVRGRLELFHVDEPSHAAPGATGMVDHADLRRHLAAISYFGWLSIVQRTLPDDEPLDSLARGVGFAAQTYLPIDVR
jgi:sugar phosphate isomerase/epimerase